MKEFNPVFIIGAARSGTKVLRDTLAQSPDIDTVPYDINYIWIHFNERYGNDGLPPSLADPKVKNYIVKALSRYSQGNNRILIEKTVSNVLRVPFIREIFPDSKYVELIRDGRDVADSVYRQWIEPTDVRYMIKKLRTYPFTSSFGYGLKYGSTWAAKKFLRKSEIGIWGVTYPGIREDIRSYSLKEVCALQWSKSIHASTEGLAAVPSEQKIRIRYEDFASNPEEELRRLAGFLGISSTFITPELLKTIKRDRVGVSRSEVDEDTFKRLTELESDELRLLGYL